MNFSQLTSIEAPILAEIARFSLDAPWERPWQAKEFEQLLINPAHRGWMAACQTEPCGYLLAADAGDYVDILSIAILPIYQRQRIGQGLLTQLATWSSEKNIKSISLDVATVNQGAIAFYKRYGFRTIGERKGYYRSSKGSIDALVMKAGLQKLQRALFGE